MSYFMTQSVSRLAAPPRKLTAAALINSLPSGWHVDQVRTRCPPDDMGRLADARHLHQAIVVEEDRVVCIRFGHDYDPDCMVMDETLYQVQGKVQNYAVMYLGESGGSKGEERRS